VSAAVVVLLLAAGLSEAVGRLVPLIARKPGVAPVAVAGLLVTGAVVEGAVFALWPLAATTIAGAGGAAGLWTPGLAAPLLLAAVLAFPLLGPLLHLLLLAGVGAGLAGAVAADAGVGWWAAAGCVALSGIGLTLTVEAVRRLVVRLSPSRPPEPVP
jgi:hypothetical protein